MNRFENKVAIVTGSKPLPRPKPFLQNLTHTTEECLAIIRPLAQQDPSNAGWQWDLARVYWSIARLELKAGRQAAALPLYEEASRMFGVLVERAPANFQWAKDKENIESELSRCRRIPLIEEVKYNNGTGPSLY